MTYLKELQKTKFSVSELISNHPPTETVIYIHIGGSHQAELEEALDCFFLDNKRSFKLVDVKRMNNLLSALIVMDQRQPF